MTKYISEKNIFRIIGLSFILISFLPLMFFGEFVIGEGILIGALFLTIPGRAFQRYMLWFEKHFGSIEELCANEGEKEIMVNGKKVYTEDDFDYSAAKIGDYVDFSVINNVINCMPPASMTYNSTQLGEPFDHKEDERTGKWRPTFATFKNTGLSYNGSAVWEYCGNCFRGENTERGKNPYFVARA